MWARSLSRAQRLTRPAGLNAAMLVRLPPTRCRCHISDAAISECLPDRRCDVISLVLSSASLGWLDARPMYSYVPAEEASLVTRRLYMSRFCPPTLCHDLSTLIGPGATGGQVSCGAGVTVGRLADWQPAFDDRRWSACNKGCGGPLWGGWRRPVGNVEPSGDWPRGYSSYVIIPGPGGDNHEAEPQCPASVRTNNAVWEQSTLSLGTCRLLLLLLTDSCRHRLYRPTSIFVHLLTTSPPL